MILRRSCLAFILALLLAQRNVAAEMLANHDFESPKVAAATDTFTHPDNWTLYSSTGTTDKLGLTSKLAQTGAQSVRLQGQGVAASYQGCFQAFDVAAGTKYVFAVQARNDAGHPLAGPSRGQISIEWKDAAGNEIDRTWGPDWGNTLSATQWTKFEMTAKAPANAARAHFVITQFDGPEAGASGGFLVDNASLSAQP